MTQLFDCYTQDLEQCVTGTLEQISEEAQIDSNEIEWAIENKGRCDTDEHVIVKHGDEVETIKVVTLSVWINAELEQELEDWAEEMMQGPDGSKLGQEDIQAYANQMLKEYYLEKTVETYIDDEGNVKFRGKE